jgi:tetratricopeptide (TPR) repeat protein
MKLAWGLVLGCVVDAAAAPGDQDPLVDGSVKGPELEFTKPTRQVSLPPLPAFDVPPPAADGSVSPRYLRLRGNKALDSEVSVKGVITWAYDCLTAERKPNETTKEAQKRIDDDPTLCERPKFYVGDAASTLPELSLWVVDVPRVYNKLELARIKKQDRTDPTKCEPGGDPKKKLCPPYKVGDQIEITGTFKLSSSHGERNSDGLLVYGRMKNLTQNWQTPGTFTRPAPPPVLVQPVAVPLPTPKLPVAIPVPKVKKSVRDASLAAANQGTKAYGMRQWDTAIERYTDAFKLWPDNAMAWYGVSAAYAQKGDWARALFTVGNASKIDPTNPMYRLFVGRAFYEKAIQNAREDQARKENRKPEEVTPDLSTVSFERALVELQLVVAMDSRLWRAHYLIGNIARYGGNAKAAATAYDKALGSDPSEAAPWIALIELYRAWDYRDQAIQVAEAATQARLDSIGLSEIWFELGMAYDDKRVDDKAIVAFDKSLDQHRDNHKARFARGQVYFRKGDHAKAKRDLEDFLRSRGAGLEFLKQQASRMLMDIAAKAAVRP